jgi:hypothetical protein
MESLMYYEYTYLSGGQCIISEKEVHFMDMSWIDANLISTLGIPAVLLFAACAYILKLLTKIDEIQDERIVEVKEYAEKLHYILDKVNTTMSSLIKKLKSKD